MQVEIAIEEADVIIFLTSGKEGLTNDDQYIARLLRKSNKPVVLGVNKIDGQEKIDNIYEFYSLVILFRYQEAMVLALAICWMNALSRCLINRKIPMRA